jgi:hypothetical protein
MKAIPATSLSTLPVLLANIARSKHSSLVVRVLVQKKKPYGIVPRLKELYPLMPVMYIKAITQDKQVYYRHGACIGNCDDFYFTIEFENRM